MKPIENTIQQTEPYIDYEHSRMFINLYNIITRFLFD